jgi:membrane-associated phospholipid phosphatase
MHTSNSTRITRRFPLALTAFAALLTIVDPAVVVGQETRQDPRDTTHAQKQAPFFTLKDAVLAGGFVGATVLMFPLDKRAAHALLDSTTQANRFLKHTTTDVEVITSPGAYLIGGALYVVGRLGKWDRVADLGWHGTEAILFSQGVTTLLKGAVGRGRPFLSNGTDPGDYHPGKGFAGGGWSSFPSGHTSTAFAAAAAVTNETSRWWPRSVWIVGPLMYGGATAVGLSRMYHNRHWGSDVLLGAAIGTFSGRKMVQYAHGHPDNRLDRIMMSTRIVPDGRGGVAVGTSIPFP